MVSLFALILSMTALENDVSWMEGSYTPVVETDDCTLSDLVIIDNQLVFSGSLVFPLKNEKGTTSDTCKEDYTVQVKNKKSIFSVTRKTKRNECEKSDIDGDYYENLTITKNKIIFTYIKKKETTSKKIVCNYTRNNNF